MIKEVKFGIVGTGAIFALSHANAIKKIPNASILSIFDVNQDRALECSQKWQIPKVAKNLDELIPSSFSEETNSGASPGRSTLNL